MLLKKYLGLIVVIVFSLLAIKPLFVPGFFPMHDDTQVARVYEMGKALGDGMFPVRWSKDLGYGFGYPLFNYYAPLGYYVGGFFMLFGVDALFATKLMLGFAILLCGVTMFILGERLWGRLGGLVSALFYVYAPYHALDTYVRGDFAELWAYAFIPLVFFGMLMLVKTKDVRFIILTALSYAAVILSHNLTAMMVSPFLFAAAFFLSEKKRERGALIAAALFLGLLLSSFYWIPAILEMEYTNVLSQIGGGADFRDHFVCLNQLWESSWGFGGSTSGCVDGLSFRVGKMHILLAVVSFILSVFVFLKHKKSQREYIAMFSFAGFIVSVFFTLSVTQFIWEHLPAMSFFQFPWRFLLLSSFFVSLSAGYVFYGVQFITKKPQFNLLILIAVLLIGSIFWQPAKLFVPQTQLSKTASDYTNVQELRWRISKISDEYMPRGFQKINSSDAISQERIVTLSLSENPEILVDKTQEFSANIDMRRKDWVRLDIASFPAWKVFVDGEAQFYDITERGLVITVDKGKHTLRALFIQTPVESAANFLSVFGIFSLIALLLV